MHALVSVVLVFASICLVASLLLLLGCAIAAMILPRQGNGDEPAPIVIPPPPEPCSEEGAHRWSAMWVEGEGVLCYECADCGKTVESFE